MSQTRPFNTEKPYEEYTREDKIELCRAIERIDDELMSSYARRVRQRLEDSDSEADA